MSAKALETIYSYFSVACIDEEYFSTIFAALCERGFRRDNSIALVNSCRDELSQPIYKFFHEQFGKPFILSGLGGILTAGITGLKAGTSHSPISKNGKEQYIFFASAHVAVDEKGREGYVLREGRPEPSKACGALVHIRDEICKDVLSQDDTIKDDDVEYGYLRKTILSSGVCRDRTLTLFDLTKYTASIITEDLESLIAKSVDKTKSDYAVLTAVHIHAGLFGGPWTPASVVDYIAPVTSYVVIDGVKEDLLLTKDDKRSYSSTQLIIES